jgi:hypothetical protein
VKEMHQGSVRVCLCVCVGGGGDRWMVMGWYLCVENDDAVSIADGHGRLFGGYSVRRM